MRQISIIVSILLLSISSFRHQSCQAGILAMKAQSLFALKQALIASKLPLGQQFILLPQLAFQTTRTTTRRPNATVVTTRPPTPTVTTPRAITTPTTPRPLTTLRPSTVIGIPQLFPGIHYFPIQSSDYPQGIPFPWGGWGQQPGQSMAGLGQSGGGIVFPGMIMQNQFPGFNPQPQLTFPNQQPGQIQGTSGATLYPGGQPQGQAFFPGITASAG